mgnify:CR=1 FL=1
MPASRDYSTKAVLLKELAAREQDASLDLPDSDHRPQVYQPVFARHRSVVPLPPRWLAIMDQLEIAFQPIASIHSARCIGLEALMRGYDRLGYGSIQAVLEDAYKSGCLVEVEAALHEKAMIAFQQHADYQDLRLFLNIDGRSLHDAAYLAELLSAIRSRQDLQPTALVLEISEHLPGTLSERMTQGLDILRQAVGRLAIDDFGTGSAGFPLLYFAQPDYIKIDRFFIADLRRDTRKKVFLRHMVNLAHLLGVQVIAEGVENEREYLLCKDIGCDLIQGYLLAAPQLQPPGTACSCGVIDRLNAQDRRGGRSDQKLIQQEVDYIIPIDVNSDLGAVFERVRHEQAVSFFPVINDRQEPLGLLRESDLKSYAYSPFGRELLTNKGYGRQLSSFLVRCPVADINTPAEKILEIFSADEDSEGLLIVQDGQYQGFLSARSLLRILNEKNLAMARDQNPLTKLPGNAMINEFLGGAMADRSASYVIAYIDFDNFKPFNDTYGFRQGDRAITLFADILNKDLPRDSCFIGHVGGDDYFAAFRDVEFDDAQALIRHVIERFRQEVESFYDAESRARGYIVAKDRDGNQRHMPLLAASAALVHIPRGHAPGSIDDISEVIAVMKKEAKISPNKLASVSIISPGQTGRPTLLSA